MIEPEYRLGFRILRQEIGLGATLRLAVSSLLKSISINFPTKQNAGQEETAKAKIKNRFKLLALMYEGLRKAYGASKTTDIMRRILMEAGQVFFTGFTPLGPDANLLNFADIYKEFESKNIVFDVIEQSETRFEIEVKRCLIYESFQELGMDELTQWMCDLAFAYFSWYHPRMRYTKDRMIARGDSTCHEVGRLATHLYPGGVLIEEDHLHHEEAVQTTLRAMKDRKVRAIYEAGFLFDDVRVRVDILERLNNGKWNLIEVKSSTRVKDEYYPDVGIQYYVLKGAGLDIDRVFLMHLNNQYVYDGKELDLEGLFSSSDLTKASLAYQEEIPEMLAELKDMLANANPPEMAPSKHCNEPYGCDFREYCTKGMPEHWVMQLSGIGQNRLDELQAMGIDDIGDIPDAFPLTAIQDRIRACVANKEAYISRELRDELQDVEHPIHFLDFETLGLAIPRYAGTRPYQGIPFQWSDRILHKNGKIEHREYLCEEDKNPREKFTLTLLDVLERKGSILTYTNYEKGIIEGLAEDLPKHGKALLATLDRLVDLYKIIKNNYYHPEFHGFFSLKSVLPAIIPEMSYNSLTVQEGQEAGIEYMRMLDPSTPIEEKEKIKKNLLEYCWHDTLAMVRIREELLKLV